MSNRPRRRLSLASLLPLTLVGAGFVLGAAFVHAKKSTPAVITHGEALCTQTASHGKAWVTELVRGENAFIARLGMAPGAKVPAHRDATEEYIHVLTGSGKITIDGKASSVGPGATIYMPAKAEVSFENGPETMTVLQVFAGPAPAKKYETWAGCSAPARK